MLAFVAALACGRDQPAGPEGVAAGYARDVEKLCDVVARSGAVSHDGNDRVFLVASWLGENLETADARSLLARIQPLEGEAKAEALEREARRVGLAGCALAGEWRGR